MARTEKQRQVHYTEPAESKLAGAEMLGADMEEAVNLLDEGIEIKEQIEVLTKRHEEIKNSLLQLQVAHDLTGFKNGNVAFIGSYTKGRRMLSVELLLENQVAPEVIQKSYREGEASWRREIKRLG